MSLPIPTAEEVKSFRLLYAQLYGVKLTDEQGSDLARRVIQIFYLKTYGFRLLPKHSGGKAVKANFRAVQ